MGKLGCNRNYGYGKQLAWAGKNALADLCGQGRFSTQATHEDRWKQFARYLKGQGINDARKITMDILEQYGTSLRIQVEEKTMKVLIHRTCSQQSMLYYKLCAKIPF